VPLSLFDSQSRFPRCRHHPDYLIDSSTAIIAKLSTVGGRVLLARSISSTTAARRRSAVIGCKLPVTAASFPQFASLFGRESHPGGKSVPRQPSGKALA